jgi:hypothetical protein
MRAGLERSRPCEHPSQAIANSQHAVQQAMVPRRVAPCSRGRERFRITPQSTLFPKRHEYSTVDVKDV